MSHLDVFEIAIMNAEGHWIIPPTVIHHGISKSALFGRSPSNPRHKNLIAKYNGDIDEDESIGVGERSATWQEIGAQLDAYTKLHGRIDTWLEWSASIIDHRGVFAGLKSVGYEHLLPLIPPLAFRPLRWFQKIRQILGLDELSLSQRNLFEILYPEDSKLSSQAHRAGPDVLMLRKILQYAFSSLLDTALPGKIENYMDIIDLDTIDIKE